MKILFLYSEAMGYTMATIDALIHSNCQVHLVYWDYKKLTPLKIESRSSLIIYNRSEYNAYSLIELAFSIQPTVTVVSGWMDKAYLRVARHLRKSSKVVCGLDGQWSGCLRQQIASKLGSFGLLKQFFSHAWVAGSRQYEYARRLGFAKENIIFDLYSADLSLFCNASMVTAMKKANHYPHTFLYVGRLESIKGLDVLLDAWQSLLGRRGDWELVLIGNGSLYEKLLAYSSITVLKFLQPKQLAHEFSKAGCFILPSLSEPWGVVVHESAAAGLPLITSNAVGASSEFLIHGFNGFCFSAGDPNALASCMLKIIQSTDLRLTQMGKLSSALSHRITPFSSAANLLSLADQI